VNPNTRFLLRVFEEPPAVRTASIILHLAGGTTKAATVTREAIIEEWGRRYPHHVALTGQRSIPRRVIDGISRLKLVNAVTVTGDTLTTGPDLDLLAMIAGNRSTVESPDGAWRHPRDWPILPVVPDHLRPLQQDVHAARMAGAGTTSPGAPRVASPRRTPLAVLLTHGLPMALLDRLATVFSSTEEVVASVSHHQAHRCGDLGPTPCPWHVGASLVADSAAVAIAVQAWCAVPWLERLAPQAGSDD
jgi:hypothetical protein